MADAPGFMLYIDTWQQVQHLSDAQAGRVFKAVYAYVETGEITKLSKIESIVFSALKGQIDRSTEKYMAKCAKNRQNVMRRWEKVDDTTVCDGIPPNTNYNVTKPNQTKPKRNSNPLPHTPASGGDSVTDDNAQQGNTSDEDIEPDRTHFDEFWTAYPKKVGKEAARKAWSRIKPHAELFQRIIEAIQRSMQSAQWKRENGRYIPNPTTWLNQGRWDDEMTPEGGEKDGNNTGFNPAGMAGFHMLGEE